MSHHLESLDQSHRRSSGNASDKDHLQPTDEALADVPPALPAAHEASLAVSEYEQGDDHCRDGPTQRDESILGTDEEVGQKRNESTDEVAQGNGERANDCSRSRGLREGVVEVHQEGREHGRGSKVVGELGHQFRRQFIRLEDVADGG